MPEVKTELVIAWDARLVEEAVLLALRSEPRAAFWSNRESIYEIADADLRDFEFSRLSSAAFSDLALDAALSQALSEQPLISKHVEACRIVRVITRKEEGAELFVNPARRSRSLAIRLVPHSLLEQKTLLFLMRHELFHIADMLDPNFSYDPVLPETPAGAPQTHLLIHRYRVIWDTTIDGRLSRRGHAPATAKALRCREFAAAFSRLGEQAENSFCSWFDCPQPTHRALLDFARKPG